MNLSNFHFKHETVSWINAIQKADDEITQAGVNVWKYSGDYTNSTDLDGMLRNEAEKIVANFEERLEGDNVTEELKFTGELYHIAKEKLEDSIPDEIKEELNW